MRVRLFCVLCASLWSATMAAGQAPTALPAELRSHVQGGRFDVVTSVRGLPLGVRNEMQTLFRTPTLDIAEPDGAYEPSGQTGNSAIPGRRMIAAGCTYVDCLVYYERGGSPRTWRVALFHWTPNETTLEWGGLAPGGLKTIADVRTAVLSGAIKATPAPW